MKLGVLNSNDSAVLLANFQRDWTFDMDFMGEQALILGQISDEILIHAPDCCIIRNYYVISSVELVKYNKIRIWGQNKELPRLFVVV